MGSKQERGDVKKGWGAGGDSIPTLPCYNVPVALSRWQEVTLLSGSILVCGKDRHQTFHIQFQMSEVTALQSPLAPGRWKLFRSEKGCLSTWNEPAGLVQCPFELFFCEVTNIIWNLNHGRLMSTKEKVNCEQQCPPQKCAKPPPTHSQSFPSLCSNPALSDYWMKAAVCEMMLCDTWYWCFCSWVPFIHSQLSSTHKTQSL